MKKIILICLLAITTIYAKKQANSIGIASAISKSDYRGVGKNDPLYFPMIVYNGDKFYFKALELGYKVIDTKPFKFSALVTPRMKTLDPDDSTALTGMEKRDRTLEAGFKIALNLIPLVSLSSTTRFDTLFIHKGFSSDIGIGVLIPFSKAFIIRASAKNIYFSKNYVDYYYGVKASEVTATRNEYKPDASKVKQYGLNFIFNLSKSIGLTISLTQNRYEEEITNSPNVSEDKTWSALAALNYKF